MEEIKCKNQNIEIYDSLKTNTQNNLLKISQYKTIEVD